MSHAHHSPAQQPAPAVAARNGLGLTALILGLVGALSGLVPILFWLSGTLGLIGLVLGLVGRSRAKKGSATNGKTALAGVLLSLAAFALGVWGLVVVVTAFGDAADELDKELDSGAAAAVRVVR
ncbi:hypothetical protein ACH4RA_23955 [Streptomyces smyrnaeus]|uniref:hypothetical protein n=1 Tax=Streptomyces TaxID=1883 RepID=UPI000C1A81AE|nr:hypothetical protein [Streptomyces sp. B15]MBQ1118953.1 hypothetical protein [Streptomyces sp. B15]MBQ1162183.1 hypothetical protein [Streptomyces sp. A73]